MKTIIENIILVEPNRFSSDEIDVLSNQFGISKEILSDLQHKKISKAWIWKDTGKIIFFKPKNDTHIKHKKIKLNVNNIQTFSLKEEVTKHELDVNSILDKISLSGLNSLTDDEKEFLKNG